MAVASGVAVANIYYNQPLLADMARSMRVNSHQAGYVATATQLGYALGMPLFIPLGDFIQRRKLVSRLFLGVAASLLLAAAAQDLWWLAGASFLVGLTAVSAQILIPFAADLSSAGEQGRTIGTMLSGVLLGILLARTVSGTVAQHLGWRTMYCLAAGLVVIFAAILAVRLPHADRSSHATYRETMLAIWNVVLQSAKLKQVCFVAAMFFAAFSAFWTTLIFLLELPPYHYGSQTAGLFGLIGAVGAGVAPLAGRVSDERSPRFVVQIAVGVVLFAFVLFWFATRSLPALIAGVIVLDAGIQAAQVANQSRVLSLAPHARNRVNTVYMIGYFSGGAIGSLAGSWAWAGWKWPGVCAVGVACMILAAIALASRGPEETARVG
ncbi:MAG: arabinose efflux permease family protein [Bryobacterales bacterium]|nr:arabinose efflux permease family protein [Bryobacterales bacterium]